MLFVFVQGNSFAAKPLAKGHHAQKIIRLAPFGETEAVRALATQIALNQDLPRAWVLQQISRARLIPSVLQLVLPAPQPFNKNWHAYRERFIEPRRIEMGVQYWQSHAALLERAEKEFGVPAEIIVGILGVETFYGQHMGAYPVLDSLVTLSLKFPSAHPRALERQMYYQNELGYFLKNNYANPSASKKEVLGSYAGAVGAAQFMPSSIAKFAIDYDNDGRIDLIHSAPDIIGSIARYFQMYGWTPGAPSRFEVDISAAGVDLDALLLPDILPTFHASDLQARGVILKSDEAKQYDGLLALIELQNGQEPKEYVLGTNNFYTVTRYNWSSYYAMAVLDLGQAVSASYLHKESEKTP